jgi:hypothetical protein
VETKNEETRGFPPPKNQDFNTTNSDFSSKQLGFRSPRNQGSTKMCIWSLVDINFQSRNGNTWAANVWHHQPVRIGYKVINHEHTCVHRSLWTVGWMRCNNIWGPSKAQKLSLLKHMRVICLLPDPCKISWYRSTSGCIQFFFKSMLLFQACAVLRILRGDIWSWPFPLVGAVGCRGSWDSTWIALESERSAASVAPLAPGQPQRPIGRCGAACALRKLPWKSGLLFDF